MFIPGSNKMKILPFWNKKPLEEVFSLTYPLQFVSNLRDDFTTSPKESESTDSVVTVVFLLVLFDLDGDQLGSLLFCDVRVCSDLLLRVEYESGSTPRFCRISGKWDNKWVMGDAWNS